MSKIDYKMIFASRFGKKLNIAERIGGGRNSKVFKLESADGRNYAAKVYYQNPNDNRNRLLNEYGVLKYLNKCGIHNVPVPVYLDIKYGFAIYEYIYGKKIESTKISKRDIEDAVEFLYYLKEIGINKESNRLHSASEACFSYLDIVKSINNRLERLKRVSKAEPLTGHLHCFLEKDLKPVFAEINKVAASYKGYCLSKEIKMCERTLSPSDFGFHNALKMEDGKIVYLDFEYFGWDDPVKTFSDFILHPGMSLNKDLKSLFAQKMIDIFRKTEDFVMRIELCFPLFVIKWCTILLNEFNQADLNRREFAIEFNDSIVKIRERQLNKAKLMLKEVNKRYV